jgi:hypothetical protein
MSNSTWNVFQCYRAIDSEPECIGNVKTIQKAVERAKNSANKNREACIQMNYDVSDIPPRADDHVQNVIHPNEEKNDF